MVFNYPLKLSLGILAIGLLLLTTCDQRAAPEGASGASPASDDRIEEQLRRYDSQLKKGDEQIAKVLEQAMRYDSILAKWEDQAKRFDRLLDRWEKVFERVDNPGVKEKHEKSTSSP